MSIAQPPIAPPETRRPASAPSMTDRREFANQLRQLTVACRVKHEKLGVRKALSKAQIKIAAEQFSADSGTLSMAKRLLDTGDPAYRAVAQVRSRVNDHWKSQTTPYPEPGIRLLRRASIEAFNAKMREFHADLVSAVNALEEKYGELRERAKEQLGDLFNEGDYPMTLSGEFDLEWDFPSIDPPEHLKQLHPQLYEQQCELIRGRLEEAVALTEQAFAAQFQKMVAHLADRLRGDADGKPKVFRDTAVANLTEFFQQFKQLDLGSAADLQQLVQMAETSLTGISAEDLRAGGDVRTRVADELAKVQTALDQMMVARPTRRIVLED